MNNSAKSALGQHWLIELQGCSSMVLRQVTEVEAILRRAAAIAGARIVSGHFHQFSPFGVSGVLVIEESHFTIHTWPEYGFAAVDIFTCSPSLHIREAIACLGSDLKAENTVVQVIRRGIQQKNPDSVADRFFG